MLNKTPYIERTNEATPDEVFVPEWRLLMYEE